MSLSVRPLWLSGLTSSAAAWTELVSWANGQARIRGAQLATARRESEGLAQQLNAAQARFTEAGAALSRLQAGATAAARQEQNAATKLSELDERISQLADQLRGVPGEDEIAAQLAPAGQPGNSGGRG